jgi:hypothetical protein
MKNSIDYNDVFDIMIKKTEADLADMYKNWHPWVDIDRKEGRLEVLKVLRDMAQADINDHHGEIADQLIKIRSIVEKM